MNWSGSMSGNLRSYPSASWVSYTLELPWEPDCLGQTPLQPLGFAFELCAYKIWPNHLVILSKLEIQVI